MPKKKQQPAIAPQTNERSGLSTERFRKSDRLQMALEGTRNRIGASCNVFECQDSIQSIAEALAWSLHVSHQQGAPSVYFGNLRPRGSTIATGGVSGGAVPFALMLDALVHNIKRDTYKKGAGIAWLPWWHEDLQEFLAADFNSIYRGVYLPAQDDSQMWRDFWGSGKAEALAKAYDSGKCFLCKLPPYDYTTNEQLFLNLCTEVRLPSRGACWLGVVNLSQYDLSTIEQFATDYADAALELYADVQKCWELQQQSPLACDSPNNRQFGLGVSGLASLLANCSVTFADFTSAFATVVSESQSPTIEEYARVSSSFCNDSVAHALVDAIVQGYLSASSVLQGKVVRAFCVQPSATGAYECADVSGYHSSPELQPVIGIRDKSGVHTIRKSQLLGDQRITFHPATETIEDVDYSTYLSLCHLWQKLLDSTGLAHQHSACFYGQAFDTHLLFQWSKTAVGSLYYRLPYYNPEAIDKSSVGEGLALDGDFSLDSLLAGGSCSLQQPDDSDCGCGG